MGMKQIEVAKKAGVSQSVISQLQYGVTPEADNALKIAAVLRLDLEAFIRQELLDAADDPPSFDASGALRRLPVLTPDEACRGLWREPPAEGRETVIADAPDDRAYAVRVPDRRMFPRYEEGEVVIVSPRERLTRDACAVVSLKDGRCLISRWREVEGRVILGALHPDFEPVIVLPKDVAFAHRIVGTKT